MSSSELSPTLRFPINFDLFFPNFSAPQPSAPTVRIVDANAVTTWVRKFDTTFAHFQKVSNNGLFSLLEKEIRDITPLLTEGKSLSNSVGNYTFLTQFINDLIKPKIQQLEGVYVSAQKKLADDAQKIKDDAGLAETWNKMGLPDAVTAAIFENHADCARFLYESKLLFAIVGFRETVGNVNEHDIRLDHDGHPLLKKDNRWVRWEIINRELHYDAKAEKIKSRGYEGNITNGWCYYHPQGLVRKDRFNYDQAFPIYQLSQEQYDRARQQAAKFYLNNPEKDIGIPKDCIVQFFSSPRRQLPENPLLDNANAQYPIHTGIRVITADRQVYSFGFRTLPEEDAFLMSNPMSTLLSTVEGKVTMIDQEEFRAHEGRIVTSVPVSTQRSQNILNFVNELNQKQLRFQYMRQNCSILMLEVLKKSGYEADFYSTGPAFIYEMIPNWNQFPVIGPLVLKVENCFKRIWEALPRIITAPAEWTKAAALFVPKKLALVATNILFWKMGTSKKTTPLGDKVEEEELYDKNGFQDFSRIFRSWTDLFKESTARIYNVKHAVAWQKQQGSTFIAPYTGKPNLAIVPPIA